MLPAWMLYTTVVGALAALTALAIERLFGIWSLPRRAVWVAAMVVTVVLPLRLATRTPTRTAARSTMPRVARAAPAGFAAARAVPRVPWRIQVYRWSLRLDRGARVVWIAGSGVVALVLVGAYASLLRRRRTWREETLLGRRVLMTPDVGPAVVGFLRPRVVIPEWALALPDRERRLMLDHEREHLDAGDPKLLLLCGVILILFPWNAALWFMTRRLRLAIEIDCDARVVGGTGAADEYGLFLLAVGERRAHGLFLAASLAERRSSLERRIHAMTMLHPRHPILASLPLAALAFGATALAAQTPQPPAAAAGGFVRAAAVAPPADRIQLTNDQMRALLVARHPDIASGKSEDNSITVVLASSGELVVSGSSKVSMARSAGASAAGGGSIARATLAPTPAAASGEAGAQAPAVVKKVEVVSGGAPTGFATFPGVGNIDRSLIKDLYTRAFEAGEVTTGALIVRVVTLTGNSTTPPKHE